MAALLTRHGRVKDARHFPKNEHVHSFENDARLFLNLWNCTFGFSCFVDISHFLEYHHWHRWPDKHTRSRLNFSPSLTTSWKIKIHFSSGCMVITCSNRWIMNKYFQVFFVYPLFCTYLFYALFISVVDKIDLLFSRKQAMLSLLWSKISECEMSMLLICY